MKIQLLIASIFVALLIQSSSLIAQEGRGQGRVTGIVKNEEGIPIEGVSITLESVKYNFKMNTVSNKEGKWGFLGFSGGRFKFTFEKEGYLTNISTVNLVQMKKNPFQEITMKKSTEIEIKDQLKDAKKNFKKANKLYEQGKYQEALPLFLDFIKSFPNAYLTRVNIGNCYLQLREYDHAIKEYETVIAHLKEKNPDLKGNTIAGQMFAGIGEAYMAQDQFDTAIKNFNAALKIDPKNHALAYNTAEILFAANKIDEAITYYTLCIKIKPKWPKAHIKLGYAYLNKGNIDQSINHFEQFIKYSPEDPQVSAIKRLIKELEKQK